MRAFLRGIAAVELPGKWPGRKSVDGVTAGLDVCNFSHYENVCIEACQIFCFYSISSLDFFFNVLLDCGFAWFYAGRLGYFFVVVVFSLLRK